MDKNFYQQYFQLEKDHWWFKVRRDLIFDLLKKYSRRFSSETRILDAGCGSGFLAGELQKMGYQATGMDNFEPAIRFGKEKGISNLLLVDQEQWPFADQTFDVVLALDVLEHLAEEEPFLKELERVLKPGGIIICTAPAYQWLWGVQDVVSHHYRRYTLSGLRKTITNAGRFKILKQTHYNTFLFPPIAVVRTFSKWFNLKERESDFDINNKWLNNLFFYIFDLERKSLKHVNFSFGVSILLVVKKEIQRLSPNLLCLLPDCPRTQFSENHILKNKGFLGEKSPKR